MSQKLAVVVGLVFLSLAARAETNLERLKRLAIRPMYPTIAPPPSTRIKDGLWKEESEYGVVRFTRGEKLTNEKIKNFGKNELTSDPKVEVADAVPASTGSISKIDQLPLDLPSTTTWHKSLSPGGSMPWHQDEEPPTDVALLKRPTPNSSIGIPGTPENLGKVPGLPARETSSTGTASVQLSQRTAPNSSINKPGEPENLGSVPGLPARETASTGTASVPFFSRPAPNIAIKGGPGVSESMSSLQGLSSRETAKGGVDFAALRGRAKADASLRARVMPDVTQASSPPPVQRGAPPEPEDIERMPKNFANHSIAALIELLKSGESPRFRARIADELGRRGAEAAAAVPALTGALNDASSRVKASAALALGNIGGDTTTLQPLLTFLLQDKNPDVKMSAETAISRLENRPVQRPEQRLEYEP